MAGQLLPRPGWKMPPAPAPDVEPCALLIGIEDGWELYWATPEQADQGDYHTGADGNIALIPWPFGDDDTAETGDLEPLGFVIL